jgi:hypothetical protein
LFLAIFLIIEEWLWDLLTVFGHKLIQWLNLEQFEQWLRQASPIMALVARVFALTQSLLLTFAFLSLIYTTIIRWLHWAHDKVTESTVYPWAKQLQV